MKTGGCCTLLFAIGVVALVANCLELISFAKVVQMTDAAGLADGSKIAQTSRSPINPLAAARAALAVGAISLLVMSDFAAAIQRSMALIRLAAAVLLTVAWSTVVVQLTVVSLAGQCQPVRHGAGLAVVSDETRQACRLLHKGTIAAVAVWACWTLLATILVFLNTHSERMRPHPLDCEFSGIPLNIFGCDPPVRPPAAAAGAAKPALAPTGQSAACVPGQGHCYNGGGHHPLPPQKQPPYQHFGMAMAGPGQKHMAVRHLRSSWSNIDEESAASEPGRGDSQSLLASQSKTQLFLHSQSMLQQLYNIQNQQLQSMQPHMPHAHPQHHQHQHHRHISQDRTAANKQQSLPKAGVPSLARRRVQSVFHRSAHSLEPAIPEPPTEGDDSYRHPSYSTNEASEKSATTGHQRTRDEQLSMQQLAVQYSLRYGPGGRSMAPRGMAASSEQASGSFGDGTDYTDALSSHFGKRNTIG
ncbi:hypothetical protein LPJ61_001078 [Coemansia biformis]|uniref:Uncharacterized protein n=1 Tax=Coemansia biformis TaxID=1286918 RepID=A0A9W7YIF8_9FUNG|nr:hypothetical protein LPJ61_001078 [Coemansia biformis]